MSQYNIIIIIIIQINGILSLKNILRVKQWNNSHDFQVALLLGNLTKQEEAEKK